MAEIEPDDLPDVAACSRCGQPGRLFLATTRLYLCDKCATWLRNEIDRRRARIDLLIVTFSKGPVTAQVTALGGTSMKIVAYLRVSTRTQAEDGQGLDIQRSKIKAWATEHGHRIVAAHRDEGVSGGLADRPGLGDALADLSAGRAQALVVARLDRLARDLVVQETLIAEVRRLGGRVRSVMPEEDRLTEDASDDPSRVFIRQIMGAVAEYERALIKLRLASGRARKRQHGGYAGGGPAYGQRAAKGALVPDDAEQAVIERMLVLREQGMSLRDIAHALDGEGHHPKRGARWYPTTIGRALARKVA